MFSVPPLHSPLLLTAVLLYQCVVVQVLGLCPLSGRIHRYPDTLRVAAALACSILLATLTTGLFRRWLLHPLQLEYFDTFATVLCVAVSAPLAQLIVPQHANDSAAQPSVPVLTQISVLGTVWLALPPLPPSLVDIIAISIASAGMFTLIYVLFAALRERLLNSDVPPAFQGAPIQLITAGLAAAALMGLAGVM